jgi:hypothetical protein
MVLVPLLLMLSGVQKVFTMSNMQLASRRRL